MALTVTFSKLMYDRLGGEVLDELVSWSNAVDATSRSDLRELNEHNFVRFDAKLEQRLAEQDARMEKRFAEQDVKFERRFAEQYAKMEKRFAEQDVKMEKRFAEQDAKFEKRFTEVDVRFAQLDGKIDRVAAELRAVLEGGLKEQTRWMFVAWATMLIPIIGLWMRR